MAEGAAACGQDQVGVAEVLEEARHPERVHAAGDDRRGRVHPRPFLMVERAVGAVVGDHVGHKLVGGLTLHLAIAHGAGVDARRALKPRHLGQHEGGVAAHRLRRGDGAMARAVIVQILAGKAAPRGGDRARSGHIAVHQKRHMVGVLGEGLQDELAARHHLVMVVRRDVGREQLGLAGLVLGAAHGVGDQRDGLAQRREDLVALRLVVLDEVAAQPEIIAGVGEGLRAQAQLGLDDGADDEAAVHMRPPQHPPQVGDGGRGAVEAAQIGGRRPEIVHLGVFDIAHALVVADGQRQERADHRPPVGDVVIEQRQRIGDLGHLLRLVDLIDQRIDAAGEVVGGAGLDVGAGRAFGGEMRGGLKIAVARLGLQDVGHQHMASGGDEVGLFQAEVGVAV